MGLHLGNALQWAGPSLACHLWDKPAPFQPRQVALNACAACTGRGRDERCLTAAGLAAFSMQVNITGQPGISPPLHWAAEGGPIGAQFAATFADGALLIRLAAQLEKAMPWENRRPPIFAGLSRAFRLSLKPQRRLIMPSVFGGRNLRPSDLPQEQ